MEFASKLRTAMWTGDGGGELLDEEGATLFRDTLPRGKVGAEEGTLLVFSNYAAVHRVLRMEAKGGAGSRDFLAFFVFDQRTPLSRRDLGESDMQVRRAKRPGRWRRRMRIHARKNNRTARYRASQRCRRTTYVLCVAACSPSAFCSIRYPLSSLVCGRRLFNPTPFCSHICEGSNVLALFPPL